MSAANEEWGRVYLENPAALDEDAIHLAIRDKAGFRLRNGGERLPDRGHTIDFPPKIPQVTS